MTHRIACQQFVYGKLINRAAARYEIIARSPNLESANAREIRAFFSEFRPRATEIPGFQPCFVGQPTPNGTFTLAHIYLSKHEEPDRSYFIQEHYVTFSQESVSPLAYKSWLLLPGVDQQLYCSEYRDDLADYVEVNDSIRQSMDSTALEALASSDTWDIASNALQMLSAGRSVQLELSQFGTGNWRRWLAAIGTLLPPFGRKWLAFAATPSILRPSNVDLCITSSKRAGASNALAKYSRSMERGSPEKTFHLTARYIESYCRLLQRISGKFSGYALARFLHLIDSLPDSLPTSGSASEKWLAETPELLLTVVDKELEDGIIPISDIVTLWRYSHDRLPLEALRRQLFAIAPEIYRIFHTSDFTLLHQILIRLQADTPHAIIDSNLTSRLALSPEAAAVISLNWMNAVSDPIPIEVAIVKECALQCVYTEYQELGSILLSFWLWLSRSARRSMADFDQLLAAHHPGPTLKASEAEAKEFILLAFAEPIEAIQVERIRRLLSLYQSPILLQDVALIVAVAESDASRELLEVLQDAYTNLCHGLGAERAFAVLIKVSLMFAHWKMADMAIKHLPPFGTQNSLFRKLFNEFGVNGMLEDALAAMKQGSLEPLPIKLAVVVLLLNLTSATQTAEEILTDVLFDRHEDFKQLIDMLLAYRRGGWNSIATVRISVAKLSGLKPRHCISVLGDYVTLTRNLQKVDDELTSLFCSSLPLVHSYNQEIYAYIDRMLDVLHQWGQWDAAAMVTKAALVGSLDVNNSGKALHILTTMVSSQYSGDEEKQLVMRVWNSLTRDQQEQLRSVASTSQGSWMAHSPKWLSDTLFHSSTDPQSRKSRIRMLLDFIRPRKNVDPPEK